MFNYSYRVVLRREDGSVDVVSDDKSMQFSLAPVGVSFKLGGNVYRVVGQNGSTALVENQSTHVVWGDAVGAIRRKCRLDVGWIA